MCQDSANVWNSRTELPPKKQEKLQGVTRPTTIQKIKNTKLEIGDRVLVRKVGFTTTHNISDKWDSDVYIVLPQSNPDLPVYKVQREFNQGQKKTLHRNMLLPVNSLPVDHYHQLRIVETVKILL